MNSQPQVEEKVEVPEEVGPELIEAPTDNLNRKGRRKMKYHIDKDLQIYRKEQQQDHTKLLRLQRKAKNINRTLKIKKRKMKALEEGKVFIKPEMTSQRMKEIKAIERRQEYRRNKVRNRKRDKVAA